jgi:2-polyprenyl-6-methoxyphenol hydroxylase-like FAD-dependent oxidoreductase
MIKTDVLIAGAGPVGLVLAHELSHRGIRVMIAERNLHSTRHPKMDITNPRSMEHFRRLGLASKIRAHATPPHHPVSVVWTDRLGGDSIARFDYPSYDDSFKWQSQLNDGTGVAEPLMRVSQIVLEPLLRELLEANDNTARVDFGWKFERFVESGETVISELVNSQTGEKRQVESKYLVGCDGAGSAVRRQLGIQWDVMDTRTGPLGAIRRRYGLMTAAGALLRVAKRGRKIPDGRVYLIHFKSSDLSFFHRNGIFWHEQCAQNGDTLIAQDDVDTWTLHVLMDASMDPEKIDPKVLLAERLGRVIDCKILAANHWRPALTIAKGFGRGRVWLAGDSCHQVIPTGGYGMNTGVGEAVTLGWMLAGVIQGWGGPKLLEAYEAERMPVVAANRNGSALNAGVRLLISSRGGIDLEKHGKYIQELGNLENEALGLEVDYRYDKSPIVCRERGPAAPWKIDAITPTTRPGARLPHVWLQPGVSVHDRLGPYFTLIRANATNVEGFISAAESLNVPLKILNIADSEIAQIYQSPLILVRPDHHVVWRGTSMPTDPLKILKIVTGNT